MVKRMWVVAAALGMTLVLGAGAVRAQGVYVMPTTGYVTPLPVGNPFLRPAGVYNYGGLIQAQQQLTATLQQFHEGCAKAQSH